MRKDKSQKLREHMYSKCWKGRRPEDIEYELATQRYPNLNLEDVMIAYLDQEETVVTLKKKKIILNKFFEATGILRRKEIDYAIRSVKSRKENYYKIPLVYRYVKQYLPKEINKVIELGLPELVPALTALKMIQFHKRQAKKKLKEQQEKS